MPERGFSLFETALGTCALAWGQRGVIGVQLPEGSDSSLRKRLRERFPALEETTAPGHIDAAIVAIRALLDGKDSRLDHIALDMEGVPPFCRRVYEVARTIPPGSTLSYGDIAQRLGSPGAARAVGQALGRNPFAIVVPCHRVLSARGKLGGFSAKGGITTKLKLLELEGVPTQATLPLFDGEGELGFDPAVAIRHLRSVDEKLARIIDASPTFNLRLQRTPSIFAALAESIVYQQLSGKAAATIFARVRALFPHGHEGPTPRQILRASADKLREAGLSQNKLLALRDLARKTLEGELPTLQEAHAMDDDTLVERLTCVRGIGRWTVEMLLIFRLGRPDILPIDDYGVRKGFALAQGKRTLPTPKQLQRYGERWRPHRTVASWYCWRALDLPPS